jgi:hypothetical protein
MIRDEEELERFISRARASWGTIRDFQSGKCLQEEDLRRAVVELRDSLIRLYMQLTFISPQNAGNIASMMNRIQESFNFYLITHEFTNIHGRNTEENDAVRRAFLTFALNNIPPIEEIIAFFEFILRSIRGSR